MDNKDSKILIIRLLEACNAGCFMCDFRFSKDTYRLSIEEASNIALSIATSPIKHIRFTGGEPFMHDKLDEIIRIFKAKNKTVSLITNGYFIIENLEIILESGLDQLVISLDGSSAATHNKYRRTPGLFERIQQGIELLKKSSVNLRINTVVGGHNIEEINEIYDLLIKWQVNQWSIIPLKNEDGVWATLTKSKLWNAYKAFHDHVDMTPSTLQFLGYSYYWAGRTKSEVEDLWEAKKSFTPKSTCNLVDKVLYFLPKENVIFPCNCIPHRKGGQEFGVELSSYDDLLNSSLDKSKDWLRLNGAHVCTGCEPINAALGENLIDLNLDIFGF